MVNPTLIRSRRRSVNVGNVHQHIIPAIASARLRRGNHPAKVQSRDGVRQDADYLDVDLGRDITSVLNYFPDYFI